MDAKVTVKWQGAAPEPEGTATFEEAIDRLWQEIVRPLLIERQGEYGPDNLTCYGMRGIYVRAGDKVARIEHMTERLGLSTNHIGYDDPLRDLAGYGIMGMMLLRGWLGLPLEEEAGT